MAEDASLLDRLSVSALDHALDVGVVFESSASASATCAHRFRLKPLVRYLDGTDVVAKGKPHNICIICQTPIALVCDVEVCTATTTKCVLFRYGKQTYRLAVDCSNKSLWLRRNDFTAQERMADVLGMNVHKGMKIICKGKVLYPSDKLSSLEVSDLLLEISQNDWESHANKPSLVVMGTRAGNEVRGDNAGWYGMLQWGMATLVRIMFSLLLWPLRTVGLLPPSHRD